MKKNLTLRYTVQQCAYWAAAAGVVSFATAFLLEQGFAPAHIGILLAAGNLLSCGCQPMLAGWADRIGGSIIKWMIAGLTLISMGCFTFIQLFPLSERLYGLLYLLGIFTFDAMNPLLNAVCVSYNRIGYSINYGVGRGIGSFAFALAALAIGKVMAAWGAVWMIWISVFLLAVNVAAVVGYPAVSTARAGERRNTECCSVPVFFPAVQMVLHFLAGCHAAGHVPCHDGKLPHRSGISSGG